MLRMRGVGQWAVVALLLVGACTSEEPAQVDERRDEADEQDSDEARGDEDDGEPKPTGAKDAGGASGTKAPPADPKVGSKDAGPATADAGATGGEGGDVPCDVAKIVGEKCTLCHRDPPQFSAPYALTKHADFQAMAVDQKRKVHEASLARVTADDKKMPPSTSPQLSADELETLTSWLEAGAPAATSNGCKIEVTSDEPTMQPAGAGGSGGASIKPIDYQDPNLECYKFTAYSQSDRQAPYMVPTTPDYYVLFTMKAPWTGTRYIRSFKSITDNKDAIHHWILFADRANNRESVVGPASGLHPDSERLFGWAPGGDDLYYDPDVGMKVTGDVSYSLETHYNNTTGSSVPDASGVEVCVTTTPPKYEVTQAWVGTDSISGTSASGVCAPDLKEPVKILAAHPHMHKKGKNMKVVVTRADGKEETVFDKPFDFDYQKVELLDITINPGDVMTTTCEYSSAARFGKGTEEEMCYFFPISYPPNSLVMDNLYSVLHGANTCIQ